MKKPGILFFIFFLFHSCCDTGKYVYGIVYSKESKKTLEGVEISDEEKSVGFSDLNGKFEIYLSQIILLKTDYSLKFKKDSLCKTIKSESIYDLVKFDSFGRQIDTLKVYI